MIGYKSNTNQRSLPTKTKLNKNLSTLIPKKSVIYTLRKKNVFQFLTPSSFLSLHFIIVTPRLYSHTLSHYLLILIIFTLKFTVLLFSNPITYSYFLHYFILSFLVILQLPFAFPSQNISNSTTTFFSQL